MNIRERIEFQRTLHTVPVPYVTITVADRPEFTLSCPFYAQEKNVAAMRKLGEVTVSARYIF